MWEQDCRGFGGLWLGSKKKSDLAIKVPNASGGYEIKFVLEAGLSESYEQLLDDARLWLEGMHQVSLVSFICWAAIIVLIAWIKQVVLVKFIEVPGYCCPLTKDQDPEESEIPSDLREILPEDVTLDRELGPSTYKGLRWTGEITEANMETWSRNADGRAAKQGNRRNLMQGAHTIIDMKDFLPQGYPQTISLDLDDFRDLLKASIKELTAERCKEAIIQYRKRMGEEPGDRDYQP
jgi:hypothetical protein